MGACGTVGWLLVSDTSDPEAGAEAPFWSEVLCADSSEIFGSELLGSEVFGSELLGSELLGSDLLGSEFAGSSEAGLLESNF